MKESSPLSQSGFIDATDMIWLAVFLVVSGAIAGIVLWELIGFLWRHISWL